MRIRKSNPRKSDTTLPEEDVHIVEYLLVQKRPNLLCQQK
jgi:hypothetical protein